MTTARRTAEAVDAAIESAQDSKHRRHLGASVVGGDCKRAVWYGFRWAKTIKHKARTLRIFRRGQDEESKIVEWLRMAGIEVIDKDPETGEQFYFKSHGGHFAGSVDGFATAIPDIPLQWALLEFKTHNMKSFKDFETKKLIDAKPQHMAQIQTYMRAFKLDWCLYIAVCKDNDELYFEMVPHVPEISAAILERASDIIFKEEAPARISNDPTWYRCKWCEYHDICHGENLPEKNCRTCAHSTAEKDGTWTCDHITGTREKTPCGDCEECPLHVYHPMMVNLEVHHMDPKGNNIEFKTKSGEIILSGKVYQ